MGWQARIEISLLFYPCPQPLQACQKVWISQSTEFGNNWEHFPAAVVEDQGVQTELRVNEEYNQVGLAVIGRICWSPTDFTGFWTDCTKGKCDSSAKRNSLQPVSHEVLDAAFELLQIMQAKLPSFHLSDNTAITPSLSAAGWFV